MAHSRAIMLRLYKEMLAEAKKFDSYNFRMYALRKIRDSFRESKHLQDSSQIQKAFEEAKNNLEIIKRQVVIGHLYSTEKLVIENEEVRTRLRQKAGTEASSSPGQIK
ncbi:LYR motif-containing protein 4 [Bacillus rossius redtenbacheri]|uniref:LYR motif-containing protein 4 n=1 Tax=Bacillus rossius redtenbacheri TaxID=93214 RepID=UPI002FDE9A78